MYLRHTLKNFYSLFVTSAKLSKSSHFDTAPAMRHRIIYCKNKNLFDYEIYITAYNSYLYIYIYTIWFTCSSYAFLLVMSLTNFPGYIFSKNYDRNVHSKFVVTLKNVRFRRQLLFQIFDLVKSVNIKFKTDLNRKRVPRFRSKSQWKKK